MEMDGKIIHVMLVGILNFPIQILNFMYFLSNFLALYLCFMTSAFPNTSTYNDVTMTFVFYIPYNACKNELNIIDSSLNCRINLENDDTQ